MNQYEKWIKANVPENPFGQCKRVCENMVVAFPELRMVRGHYYDMVWGERGHWWLVTPNGETVDPTAAQFPTKGHGVYVEWNEGDEEPTGKCPNCGTLCYGGDSCCSKECGESYVAYINMSIRKKS